MLALDTDTLFVCLSGVLVITEPGKAQLGVWPWHCYQTSPLVPHWKAAGRLALAATSFRALRYGRAGASER